MPKTATTPKTSRVIVRLTPQQAARAETVAARLGLGPSEWLRALAVAAMLNDRDGQRPAA